MNGGVLSNHLKQDIMPNTKEWGLLLQSLQSIYIGQDALLRPSAAAPEHALHLALIESNALTKFALETLPTRGLHVHVLADKRFRAIIK